MWRTIRLKLTMMMLTNNIYRYCDENIASEFYNFWDYFLSRKYLSPQKVKIISQWFVLKYRFGYSRLKFSFNIYEISKSIYANAISHHEERIDKGYYYYDTRNELLFNKGFLAKKEHEYPIIAIFLPAFDTQGILCMNGIIEGNHRVTNAKINNQKIDVVIIDTILLPLDVFGSTNEWLLYIMLANYYELMYKPEYFTSYSDIEKHLLKNEVA